MTEVVVTSTSDLRRIVDASVEAAAAKILHRLQPAASGPKPWLTNKEAMDFLGLSKTTLQRYRASGQLPYSKLGGSIFYRYEDLAAVLEAHLVTEEQEA